MEPEARKVRRRKKNGVEIDPPEKVPSRRGGEDQAEETFTRRLSRSILERNGENPLGKAIRSIPPSDPTL